MKLLYFVTITACFFSNVTSFHSFDTLSCVKSNYNDFFQTGKKMDNSKYDKRISLFYHNDKIIHKSKDMYISLFKFVRRISSILEKKKLSITDMRFAEERIIIDWTLSFFIFFSIYHFHLEGSSTYILNNNKDNTIVTHYLFFNKLTKQVVTSEHLLYYHPFHYRPIRIKV